ncbi:MAG: PQQ-binding-like beta-propeller repeat protein [Phycisphaerae bacterium]|nr:PQQ-binding-like beta-propeller repeat protein [Phycisphaerae bacterium]
MLEKLNGAKRPVRGERFEMHGSYYRLRFLVLLLMLISTETSARSDDNALLRQARTSGGLCVVLGAKDHALAAKLAADRPFIVHCLVSESAIVAAGEKALAAGGLYGRVSLEHWSKPFLPHADNLASMIVVVDPMGVSESEMLRALRPGGELLVSAKGKWLRTVKPRPKGMDDWTHWRRAPDRNAVSKDTLVDVPRRLQWLFTPREVTERSHVVIAGGRFFAQCNGMLIARDAFNGLGLWKAKLKRSADFAWEYRVKVAALIVAKGDRVYCLASDGKFKALDAATGKTVKVYKNAGVPQHILVVGGASGKGDTIVLAGKDSLRALDEADGNLKWRFATDKPHNVIASDYGVFYIEGNDRNGAAYGRITGRDLETGKRMWTREHRWARRTELGAYGHDRIVYELRRPNNWREYYVNREKEKEADRKYQMVVISAKTGKEIQKISRMGSSARHGEFRRAFWYKKQLLTEKVDRDGLSIALFGLDDLSKPADVFRANYSGDRGFGHCYPPVLTERFYINGQLHFTDLDSRKQTSNQITRGACNTSRAGYIPANGMIYTFPKHCICFPMLEGNVALAPGQAKEPKETTELVKGPAWPGRTEDVSYADQWPTFRRDAYHSGGTETTVPAKLEVLWSTQIKGPDYSTAPASEWIDSPYTAGAITAPVIAGGTVYVAQSDTHRLTALNEKTGAIKWEFTANGRLDGPPTIHRGLCLIGSRSGWIFCLQASNGELVWKLRIAPFDRRICTYGQVTSPWPVHGSIPVVDGLAYAAAGVHPNADGGIRVICFKPQNGRIVWKNKFSDLGFNAPWPAPYDPRKKRPESNPWRTIRPREYRHHDLPVRDGDSIAISRCLFDLKTGKRNLKKTSGFYRVKETGVQMPRTAWRYGTVRGVSPIAVFSGRSVFSTVPGMKKMFRLDFDKDAKFNSDWVGLTPEDEKARLRFSTLKLFRKAPKWTVPSNDSQNHLNRAMLVAGDNLFTVRASGLLTVRSVATGEVILERKLERSAFDGLAASGGRLFVSTVAGKVICLGGK